MHIQCSYTKTCTYKHTDTYTHARHIRTYVRTYIDNVAMVTGLYYTPQSYLLLRSVVIKRGLSLSVCGLQQRAVLAPVVHITETAGA